MAFNPLLADNDVTTNGTITAISETVAVPTVGKGTVTMQVTGTYTGALTPQVTTDGTNWITQTASTTLLNMNTSASSATIASGSTGIWQIEINGHAQFRLIALGAVTGTATITLRAAAGTSQVTAVVQGGSADDAAASGNPVPVGGIYNGSLPNYTAGDRAQLQVGSRGSLNTQIVDGNGFLTANISTPADAQAIANGLVVRALNQNYNGTNFNLARQVINATDSTGTGIAAAGMVGQVDEVSPTAITENQFGNVRMSPARAMYTEEGGRSFSHITAAAPTTTTPKSAAGFLHTLTINTSAANGVITIYDNTAASGTIIAIITQPAALLSSGPVTITYDVAFGTGLTIVTSGAAQDITISYR